MITYKAIVHEIFKYNLTSLLSGNCPRRRCRINRAPTDKKVPQCVPVEKAPLQLRQNYRHPESLTHYKKNKYRFLTNTWISI